MEKETIIHLLEKIESGAATAEELARYNELYAHFQNNEDWNTDTMGVQQEIGKLMYGKIYEKTTKTLHRPKIYSVFSYAAAVVLIAMCAGLYFYKLKTSGTRQLKETSLAGRIDLPPGGNKAILTLANGNQISLTDAANGDLVKQSHIAITKTANGQVVYKVSGTLNNDESLPLQYNTIATPKGGEYQVLLPDGSKVWLNAASSLKFPTMFASNERMVELTGEAYFEAAKDQSKPFIVMAKGTRVEVLGTHFNIMAYADEKVVKTTLLEGAVALSKGSSKVTLKPGQEGGMREGERDFKVENIDVAAAVAWKNGLFYLQDDDLESIMRKVSRWYDVDVVYKDVDKDLQFGGTISRYESVSQVLDKLELTGGIHFKIEGRRILVMK
jgi:transmembrane sensor